MQACYATAGEGHVRSKIFLELSDKVQYFPFLPPADILTIHQEEVLVSYISTVPGNASAKASSAGHSSAKSASIMPKNCGNSSLIKKRDVSTLL